jgi:dolichyl-phosphate beta-glucosyltransferase
LPSEKTYRTSSASNEPPAKRQLPCWLDRWLAERGAPATKAAAPRPRSGSLGNIDDALGVTVTDFRTGGIEPAEVAVSVVMPAYNEELRIEPALAEAVEYLDAQFGRPGDAAAPLRPGVLALSSRLRGEAAPSGYEIVVVDDGSTDATEEVALRFARENGLHDVLRYVRLERNRGKGGAITHGFRHVRGEYVLFADADGASRFSDLGRLIEGVEHVADPARRGVAIGSRSHLVGSDAVVKVGCAAIPATCAPRSCLLTCFSSSSAPGCATSSCAGSTLCSRS